MANRYHGGAGIKAGQTSVSILIRLLSTAGAAVTGKTNSDLTAYYLRQGGSPTAITLSALAAINSAYSSGGVKEADATNMKGLYRLDLPDAMVATGADWVVLQVQCSGAMDYPVFLPLETVGDSENYDRVGAPAGASVSADIAAVLTAITAIVAAVWAYATRTLTTGAVTAANVTSTKITAYRGTTWSISFTDVGALTGYSKLYFTVKKHEYDTDAQALMQIEIAGGLTVLNGATYTTTTDGSITVDDAATGDVTVTVKPAATKLLQPATNLYFDFKSVISSVVTVEAIGTITISADVTRAVS